jgi:hypothetical protein
LHRNLGIFFIVLGFAVMLLDMTLPYVFDFVMDGPVLLVFNIALIVGICLVTFSVVFGFNYLGYDKSKHADDKIREFNAILNMLVPTVIASIPLYFIAVGLWASGFYISISAKYQGLMFLGITGFTSFMYQIVLSAISSILLIMCRMDFRRAFAVAGIVLYVISLVLLSLTMLTTIFSFVKYVLPIIPNLP